MTDTEMGSRPRAHQRRAVRGIAALGAVALWILALAGGAESADLYLAPGFFAGGLTAASSWEDIRRAPGIAADFPHVGFGVRFVPLDRTCLAEGRLQPLDGYPTGGSAPAREAGRYVISVFKVIPTSLNLQRVFLFDKTFEVSACPPR